MSLSVMNKINRSFQLETSITYETFIKDVVLLQNIYEKILNSSSSLCIKFLLS